MTSSHPFAAVRTLADLAAVRDAHTSKHPDPSTTLDPAAARAVRACEALVAVVPYGERTHADTDDLGSVLADLAGDLRHLADQLGLDWHDIDRRAQSYYGDETGRDHDTEPAVTPEVEIAAVRDPDGPTSFELFVDGTPVVATEYVIDAGAGWGWTEWKETRDHNLAAASPAVRAVLLAHYVDPPGGKYVEGRDDAPWIDPEPALDAAGTER